MDPNAAIVQHLIDRQNEISGLRAEIERLTQENAELSRENHGLRGQIAAT